MRRSTRRCRVRLEAVDVTGSEVYRFVEGDGAVVALGEEAVRDGNVEVDVRVQRGAEAVQEADGAAELRAGTGAGAGALERGADGAQQGAQHGAGEVRVARQEGADPLRQ